MYNIIKTGWNDFFKDAFTEFACARLSPARVISEHRERYIIMSEAGEADAEVTGRFMFTADTPSNYPKTGDWVAVSFTGEGSPALIHAVVARQTVFSRKTAGVKAERQILAANVDTAFIVQGLDDNYNPMRLTRFITALSDTGIKSVIILNKSDLNPKSSALADETRSLFPGTDVLCLSALTGSGTGEIQAYLKAGTTCVFTGSSGVGKSTIINSLLGENDIETKEVSQKGSRGRHTTTSRQLYFLKSGAMLIDTPGIRELSAWTENGIASGFPLIDRFAAECRYRDCSHENEPGCGVVAAYEKGEIPEEIMKSFTKLKKEAQYLMSKIDERAGADRKKKEKQLGRAVKGFYKTSSKRK